MLTDRQLHRYNGLLLQQFFRGQPLDKVEVNATPPATFQDLILTLQHYWAKQGCVLQQPYDMEMGAGTFHPATFLRAIGPEPWSAAYIQPCRRPTDGRYGEKMTSVTINPINVVFGHQALQYARLGKVD